MNYYVHEKLLELEAARLKNHLYVEPPKPHQRPLFGALAALTGRTLRRAGEGLESWANAPIRESEHTVPEHARR